MLLFGWGGDRQRHSGLLQSTRRCETGRTRHRAASHETPDLLGAARPVAELARIPFWDAYRYSQTMTTQIAVRLPDEMVAFLDRAVSSGTAPSRAALVATALEREMRRRSAEEDAEILRSKGPKDDLDELVDWAASHADLED